MDTINLFEAKADNKANSLINKKRADADKETSKLGASNRLETDDRTEKSQFSGKLKKVTENQRQENDDGNKLPSEERAIENDEIAEKNENTDKDKNRENPLDVFLSQLNYGLDPNNQMAMSPNMLMTNGTTVNSMNYFEGLNAQQLTASMTKGFSAGGQQGGNFDFQKQIFDQDKLLASVVDKKKGEGESFSLKTANLETAKLATSESTNRNVSDLSIKTPVTNKNWNKDFNNHIALMAKNGGGDAKIKLNPAHLGPIEANVKIVNEVATVNIAANQLQTRDALDSGILRLKEMLEEQGFSQVDVNVSQDDTTQGSKKSDSDEGDGQGNSEGEEKGDDVETGESQVVESSVINGVLDAFA